MTHQARSLAKLAKHRHPSLRQFYSAAENFSDSRNDTDFFDVKKISEKKSLSYFESTAELQGRQRSFEEKFARAAEGSPP